MNRYVLALALATSVTAQATGCAAGQHWDLDLEECNECPQYTTSMEFIDNYGNECDTEYVAGEVNFCERWEAGEYNPTGRRMLCGGVNSLYAAVSLAIVSALLY